MMIIQNKANSIAGWFFDGDVIGDAVKNEMMLNASLDFSNACNLNCSYCYIEEKSSSRKVRKNSELSLEETIKIIKDLKQCGAKTINIVGSGEPTIDPHFEELIECIYNQKIQIVLFTNGIRIAYDVNLLRLLMQKKVSVVLKYNSFSKEKQDLITGREGYALKRDKALELLIDSGFNAYEPTRLGLDIMVFQGNYAEVPKIHKFCRENNIFPISGDFIPSGRTDRGIFNGERALFGFSNNEKNEIIDLLKPISDHQKKTLNEVLKEIDANYGIKRVDKYSYLGGEICTQMLGLYIDILGNIWPCVARKIVINDKLECGLLGNYRNGDNLLSIWKNNEYLKKIRELYDGSCIYKKSFSC